MNEAVISTPTPKKKHQLFSWPLFVQSIKANWVFWLIITLGTSAIMAVINVVIGTQSIAKSIDMAEVNQYISDENMNWIQILGLLYTMGFSLNKIQMMATMDFTTIINQLIYNVAALLLPLVYVIVVGNKLICSQVDSGSMAYIVSTPTNRGRIVRTQGLFFLLSLLAMYLVVGGASVISEYFSYGYRAIPLRTTFLNLGLFITVLGLGGVCFLGSCLFNRTSKSLAFGGGISIFSFIANVLAIFGSNTFVSLGVGVKAMSYFSYVSLVSLFDTNSIDAFSKYVSGKDGGSFTLVWMYKLIAMLVIAIVCFIVGNEVFKKKDLPL
jgi:ABC-type transport system involved in multi-copper enzyme maturation permease subunit